MGTISLISTASTGCARGNPAEPSVGPEPRSGLATLVALTRRGLVNAIRSSVRVTHFQ